MLNQLFDQSTLHGEDDVSITPVPHMSSSQSETVVFQDMFSELPTAMDVNDWDRIEYFLDDITLLIGTDTGRHAEFLDMQASLVQCPSFNLLCCQLVDDLDSKFEVWYTNEDGCLPRKLTLLSQSRKYCFKNC